MADNFKHGPLTVADAIAIRECGVDIKVIFNGEDVSMRSFYADDITGECHMYLHDDRGRPYLDEVTKEVAREEVIGDVEIRFITTAG